MEPLAVELRLLTDLAGPDLRLVPGRGLMARVVNADGLGRGTLNIAGALLEAELPPHLRPGDEVRLVVRALDEHRVELTIPKATPPAVAEAPTPNTASLPGQATLQVLPDPEQQGGSAGGFHGGQTLALRFETPALGALQLQFELTPGALRVNIAAGYGEPLQLAQTRASDLRGALGAVATRPVLVNVVPRRDPLDTYA